MSPGITKKKFMAQAMEACKKKSKKYWVPGALKSWGCKKGAEKAWNDFQKNAPKKNKIAGVTLFEIDDDIKLKF